jgi:hypothetical protein
MGWAGEGFRWENLFESYLGDGGDGKITWIFGK